LPKGMTSFGGCKMKILRYYFDKYIEEIIKQKYTPKTKRKKIKKDAKLAKLLPAVSGMCIAEDMLNKIPHYYYCYDKDALLCSLEEKPKQKINEYKLTNIYESKFNLIQTLEGSKLFEKNNIVPYIYFTTKK
jgi:hypothetical protein